MPIYEYQCAKCGKTIEVIQKMSDKPLKKHEGCGGALTKLISAAGFQFKGTGWYVTDYARKSSGESGSGESAEKKTQSKEASSNGGKESSSSGSASAKTEGGKGKTEKGSSSKSSSKKD
jgi:putative FmdB family regulatory protein